MLTKRTTEDNNLEDLENDEENYCMEEQERKSVKLKKIEEENSLKKKSIRLYDEMKRYKNK